MTSLILIIGLVAAAHAGQTPAGPCEAGARPLTADRTTSIIKWRGTKFWGLGSHEGTVALSSGVVCVRDNRIVGAEFVADMRTIDVTDIPDHESVPRRRLREHLFSEDFFHVQAHPQARLTITRVEPEQRSLSLVHARLTMRGVSHDVRFYARVWRATSDEVVAEARFAVDRQRWGVRYRGSTIRDDLVDDEFWLDLRLRATGTAR